jgi:hypothetical protein
LPAISVLSIRRENHARGRDERVGVRAFDESVEFTYRLLKTMSRSK